MEVTGKTGIPPDEQRLIYGGKQLEDDEPLTAYRTLGPRSTVFLVLRLPGGSVNKSRQYTPHLPKGDDNCYICFTDCDETLLMPCDKVKHSMCPPCLVEYAWSEAKKKSKICCALCGSEWGLEVIQEYGQVPIKEIDLLSETLSLTMIQSDPMISSCPGCASYCERKDIKNSRVHCRYCIKQGGKNSDFCWHCKQAWETSGNKCGNPKCSAAGILAQVQNAPMTEVVGVSCPSIRLCPKCGTPIEHKSGCKHMVCKACKGEFCFICLRLRVDRSWQCGSYNTKCTAAPVQMDVPRL